MRHVQVNDGIIDEDDLTVINGSVIITKVPNTENFVELSRRVHSRYPGESASVCVCVSVTPLEAPDWRCDVTIRHGALGLHPLPGLHAEVLRGEGGRHRGLPSVEPLWKRQHRSAHCMRLVLIVKIIIICNDVNVVCVCLCCVVKLKRRR